jgi:uncharacterized membrane protein YvlD (DUF360 family)
VKRFWGILGRYVLLWLVFLLSLLLVTSVLPGVYLDTARDHWWVVVLTVPVEFAILVILLRPLLLFLTLPLNALTLGIPSLLFNGLILKWTADMNSTLVITSYPDALISLLVMTVVATSVAGWLGLDEVYPLVQTVLYRIGRRWGPRASDTSRHGVIILQIDGLSTRSLVKALRRGRVPMLSALLASGTHQLHRWHCGLPSNTPAVQAGMLYGSRQDVPGYRWFDRAEQAFKVVSSPATARELEVRATHPDRPPLLAGGSCISSMLSGGARKRLLTVSALSELRHGRRDEQADLNLFYLSPNAYTKALLAGVWEYLAGLTLGLIGQLRRGRPRLKKHAAKLAQGAVANSVLRQSSFFWIRQDLVRGVPVIYSNFVGYDDVAHYSGPDDYEAQVALASFDRGLRKLRRFGRRHAAIRYEVVLLSDHGQTPSVPFRSLHGRTLGQVVADLAGQAVDQGAATGDAAYLDTLLREMARGAVRPAWAVRRGSRTLTRIRDRRGTGADQEGRSDRSLPAPPPVPTGAVAGEAPEIAVCVSGCLAHLYVKGADRRLTLEEVRAMMPGLVAALATHPGVGFVAAMRQDGDAVVLGRDGVRNLTTGEVAGQDPLRPFGQASVWGPELARLVAGESSGDLVLNGAWLAQQRKVVVFEEQTSSHGGLGGPQTDPFLMTPTTWRTRPADLRSPEALYAHFRANLPQTGFQEKDE